MRFLDRRLLAAARRRSRGFWLTVALGAGAGVATIVQAAFLARVVSSVFVDGADPGPDGEWDTWDDIINIEGGLYTIRFRNRSYLDDGGVFTNVSACGQPFKRGGDDDYTFEGSITDDFNEFINASGYITLLAFNEEWGDGARQINTDAISCDYVEIAFDYKNGNISTYNFSGVTRGTGPHYSWTGKQDSGTPGVTSYALGYFANNIPGRLYSTARSEMTDSDYEYIAQWQGKRHHVAHAGGGENACTWHQFQIDMQDYTETLAGNVSSMDLRWYGYQHKAAESADNDPMWFMIWNDQRSFYHILDGREQHAGYSWVKVYQGASKDYLFTSTATDADDNPVVTITCYLRQTPGPSAWWEEQTMDMLSWNVIWH